MTGTTIAQAIPIAISPILTRIYTPEDFGVLALFISISGIFGSIATARYELAIMLPEKDEEAINITALGISISFLLSLFLLLAVIVFHPYLVLLIGNPKISTWLYFIPIIVFVIGVYNALYYFNTRKKYFKNMAGANITKSIVLTALQLSVRFVKGGALGLITGHIASYVTAVFYFYKRIKRDFNVREIISVDVMQKMASRYIKFPKFSLWATLANTLSSNLLEIFISTVYSIATLGFYSLSNRVLGLPSALLGDAMGKVFFQKATEEKQQTGKAITTFKSTLKYLIIIGLPAYTILFFIVEDAFAFIFGEQWRIAGVYSKYLVFFFFVRFVMGPLSIINSIFEKQQISLMWQSGLLILVLILFLVASVFDFSIFQFLTAFTIVSSIYYFIMIPVLYYIAKGAKWKK